MNKKFSVLTINRSDKRGGAAVVAWNLFEHFQKAGWDSFYAVQQKISSNPSVVVIDNEAYRSAWTKAVLALRTSLRKHAERVKGLWTMAGALEWIADPGRAWRRKKGIEEFSFDGSRHVLKLVAKPVDVVHTHVLHGGYFDLRYLRELSATHPVFCTLHDAWMLSGHCAHSFGCTRWETGCGECPDLTIPVPIEYDNSALNWKRKEAVYKNSKLYIATPCQWLMDKVSKSMLANAAVEMRVIPNGVDPAVFYPGDRAEARRSLEIPVDAVVFLFAANGIRQNRWKDFELMRLAVARIAEKKQGQRVIFLALGEEADAENFGTTEIRFMPYRSDPRDVAAFYRAADVYLHAAKAETFPTTILESLSCGTPVIATAVGGIPEQVKGWSGFRTSDQLNRADENNATGILVAAGDAVSFTEALVVLMDNTGLRHSFGKNAAADASERFTLQRQGDAYLSWYKEVIDRK